MWWYIVKSVNHYEVMRGMGENLNKYMLLVDNIHSCGTFEILS